MIGTGEESISPRKFASVSVSTFSKPIAADPFGEYPTDRGASGSPDYSNIPSSMNTRTSANTPRTAAAIARPLSSIVMAGRVAAPDRDTWGRGALGAAALTGAAGTAGRTAAGGGGAPAGAGAPDAGAAVGAAAEATAGVAATAGVGILIVGAAVGFGGRLIRTVSFLGWTLAPSAGLGGAGGAGGAGGLGVFSAINFLGETRNRPPQCQPLSTTIVSKGDSGLRRGGLGGRGCTASPERGRASSRTSEAAFVGIDEVNEGPDIAAMGQAGLLFAVTETVLHGVVVLARVLQHRLAMGGFLGVASPDIAADPVANLSVCDAPANDLDHVLVRDAGCSQPASIEASAQVLAIVLRQGVGQVKPDLVDVAWEMGPAAHGLARAAGEDGLTHARSRGSRPALSMGGPEPPIIGLAVWDRLGFTTKTRRTRRNRAERTPLLF